MKKFFLISIPLILIGLLGWWFFSKSNSPVAVILRAELPFGVPENVNIPATTEATNDTVGQNTSFDQSGNTDAKIFRIVNTPVAGFTILTKGGETFVRYLERATGHIFDTRLSTLEKERVTNNTLPKVYEAYFRPDGNAVLIRSVKDGSDTVKSMILTLTPPRSASSASTSSPQASELYAVSATSVRGEVGSVVVGGGSNLFYSLKDSGAIVSSNFTSSAPKTLFSSAFTDWNLGRMGSNLLVNTRPSVSIHGYAYSLGASGGALSKLLGPLNGLSVIANPVGSFLLYSYSDGQMHLSTKNVVKGSVLEILPATLAEKCVWSTKKVSVFFCGTPVGGLSGGEPDGWYLGQTHFTDYIWQFDTASEIAKLISEPKAEFSLDLDISEPKLTPNEDYLVFLNHRDLTLWAVKLD